MRERIFASIHPVIALLYLASVVIFAMFLRSPFCLAIGLVFAAAAYLCIRGRSGMKTIAIAMMLVPLLAVFNALFNTMGQTILFTYLGNRSFTLESLAFGATTGAMFSTVLLWFGCLNRVMTADKFTYLFGRYAPAITLTLTMTMRFIPSYQRKFASIVETRKGIGKASNSTKDGIRQSSAVLSALTTWALEESIVTADSMRSRGYGCAGRTSYMSYRFKAVGVVMIVAVLFLDVCVAFALASGCFMIDFFPSILMMPATGLTLIGFAAYTILCSLPCIAALWEEVRWHASLSRV